MMPPGRRPRLCTPLASTDDPLRKIFEDLHDELAHVSPARAASIDPHDPEKLEEIIVALQGAAPSGYRFFVNAAGSFGFWRRR